MSEEEFDEPRRRRSRPRELAGEPRKGGEGSMASKQPRSAQQEAAQQDLRQWSTDINRVGEGQFPKVKLVEPTDSGYILIAAEVDHRLPVLPNSGKKRRLIAECHKLCQQLAEETNVVEAVVFDAIFIPPGGEGKEFLKKRRARVRFPRYDLSVLIETSSPETAAALKHSALYERMEQAIRAATRDTFTVTATNRKRMGPVDHRTNGFFLINYFVADDTEQNLDVWEYTAGWWAQETGLDNSTVLLPCEGEETEYSIINHCRWDHLRDFMPSILFKPSFRNYVLANFSANNIAPRAIIYRLA
jgi:hypothetical protein